MTYRLTGRGGNSHIIASVLPHHDLFRPAKQRP
jgi:hypothetical protein